MIKRKSVRKGLLLKLSLKIHYNYVLDTERPVLYINSIWYWTTVTQRAACNTRKRPSPTV
jgi:hypothetical protein